MSLKGREVFRLRYPDPTSYTVETGEPDVATDGSLGLSYWGLDNPAHSWESGEQGTIDVDSAPAADEPAAPAPTPSQPSQWELCKLHTSMPGLRDLMEWIEGTSKKQFSPRDAHSNKQLRSTIPNCTTGLLRELMEYLAENDLLVAVDADSFQLAQGQ